MERDRDYLYHCNGCDKADKNYPDKEVECEECGGSGHDDGMATDHEEGCCWKCDGYGAYTDRVSPLEYHEWARNDAYGMYTGLYCHKCYDNPEKYTYRKDRYFDEGYAGERLEEDY